MQALTTRSLQVIETEGEFPVVENVRSALLRGLPEFAPALTHNDGTFVVCGSGPSLPSFVAEIRSERLKGRPICSVNGAHNFLVENKIEPDLFVSCDPRITIRHNVELKNDRTCYMVGSRCHPEVFDYLADKNVVIWHVAASKPGTPPPADPTKVTWEDLNMTAECELWKGRFGVSGGTTSGLRAISIGFLMGFRKFILYGFDSCLAKDKFTKRFSGENIGKSKLIDVIVAGERFWCNGAMAHQAMEFQEIYKGMPNCTIEAKGDGLIAAILKARRARGYAS